MKGFRQKVAAFIHQHQLLDKDKLHLVALSGGADSVALLLTLMDLGYRVEAVHCNFHLRGEESDRDEQFVKKLCDRKNIPLHLIHFDTKTYASLHQVSIEMAARSLRYAYFRQLCQDIGASTVSVAHHRDDAVETFLMNLLRGSGIHGLTGIRPRNGLVVRPLLAVSRQEVEAYLHDIGQDYVTDSTNLEDTVLRNKIRLNVLPLLQAVNPNASDNIDKTAHYLREVEKIIDRDMVETLKSLVETDARHQGQSVAVSKLLLYPSPEVLLYEWLAPFGFNSTQISQILTHLNGPSGREFVSNSHQLVIDRQRLILEPISLPMKPMRIPEPGRYCYTETMHFDFREDSNVSISKSDLIVTLDKSKVAFPLTIRPVEEGDTFWPFGMNGHKLVSDFLTDRKLTVFEKRRQLVITDAQGTIIWLVGLRTDERYKVDSQTRSVLRITLIKEND